MEAALVAETVVLAAEAAVQEEVRAPEAAVVRVAAKKNVRANSKEEMGKILVNRSETAEAQGMNFPPASGVSVTRKTLFWRVYVMNKLVKKRTI